MNKFLLALFFSITVAISATSKKAKTKEDIREVMIQLAFVDGCMRATIAILRSIGIPEKDINIPGATEVCHAMATKRVKEYKF